MWGGGGGVTQGSERRGGVGGVPQQSVRGGGGRGVSQSAVVHKQNQVKPGQTLLLLVLSYCFKNMSYGSLQFSKTSRLVDDQRCPIENITKTNNSKHKDCITN